MTFYNPIITPSLGMSIPKSSIGRMTGNAEGSGGATIDPPGLDILREWTFDDLTGVNATSDIMDGGTVYATATGLDPSNSNFVRISAKPLAQQPAAPNDQDDSGWSGDIQDLSIGGTAVYGFCYRLGSNFLPFSGKFFMERPMDVNDPGTEIHQSMNMWHVRACTNDSNPATDEMAHAVVQAPGGSGLDENNQGPWYSCGLTINVFDHIGEWIFVRCIHQYGVIMQVNVWLRDGTTVQMSRTDYEYVNTPADLYAGRFRLSAYISSTNGSTDSNNPYGATSDPTNTHVDLYWAGFHSESFNPPSWFWA